MKGMERPPLYRRHTISFRYAGEEELLQKLQEMKRKGHTITHVELESETKH